MELAVDFHAIRVMNAHNFQRCIKALWKGYYHIQYYEDDRLIVGPYKNLTSRSFRDHFDVQRMRGMPILAYIKLSQVPLYQNLANLFFTLLFLVLYTVSVNTPNDKGMIDTAEGFLFAFALGFFFDELTKMYTLMLFELISRYEGGIMVVDFWSSYNVYFSLVLINSKMLVYTIFAICFVLRIIDYIDYTHNPETKPDDRVLSYDLLACLAPFLCSCRTKFLFNGRLSPITVSRFLPVLWNDDYRLEKDDKGDGCILLTSRCDCSWIHSELFCVF